MMIVPQVVMTPPFGVIYSVTVLMMIVTDVDGTDN
jgi:hypothetical protein